MMKFIKKIFLLFSLFLSLFCCSQHSKNTGMTNKLDTLYKEIKDYNIKPEYWLFIHSNNCSYIATIDDMPIFTDYNEGSLKSLSFPVNNFLLESGKHTIRIKILPTLSEDYHMEPQIAEGSTIKIKITKSENKSDTIVLEKEILFEKENLIPYKDILLDFEADIPYSLKGWKNSVDLSKEDKKQLEKEVVTFYQNIMKDYENKDFEKVSSKYYKRQLENAEAFYSTKEEDSQKLVQELTRDLNKEQNFKLENYKMEFYGNGKVVGLVRTDGEFLGKSAFLGLTDEDFYIYSLLLHRPTPNSPLEVIR